jgi:hypothetical protein
MGMEEKRAFAEHLAEAKATITKQILLTHLRVLDEVQTNTQAQAPKANPNLFYLIFVLLIIYLFREFPGLWLFGGIFCCAWLFLLRGTPKTQEPETSEDEQCRVCFDRKKDHVLVPCGHLILCAHCAPVFVDKGCPLCRKTVRQVLKIYA